MTITAITGDIGSGKSWKMLQYALYCCNRYKKKLVTNYGLNIPALKRYASAKKYHWIVWLCDNQQVTCLDLTSPDDLVRLLATPGSVVCLDEAGIFLNSRQFAKTPQSLLSDLAQSRKMGCDLIYAAQFDAQVDKQFRLLTQYFVHAEGTTTWCKKLRNQKLIWKKYTTFTASKYWEWIDTPSRRNNPLRTFFAAISVNAGPLTRKDKMLFDCFESFGRLDQQATQVRSRRQSYDESELLAAALRDSVASSRLRRQSQRKLKAMEKYPQNRFALKLGELGKLRKYSA
jgi:hypothetical protein